jgi:hypothetical protein
MNVTKMMDVSFSIGFIGGTVFGWLLGLFTFQCIIWLR